MMCGPCAPPNRDGTAGCSKNLERIKQKHSRLVLRLRYKTDRGRDLRYQCVRFQIRPMWLAPEIRFTWPR